MVVEHLAEVEFVGPVDIRALEVARVRMLSVLVDLVGELGKLLVVLIVYRCSRCHLWFPPCLPSTPKIF